MGGCPTMQLIIDLPLGRMVDIRSAQHTRTWRHAPITMPDTAPETADAKLGGFLTFDG